MPAMKGRERRRNSPVEAENIARKSPEFDFIRIVCVGWRRLQMNSWAVRAASVALFLALLLVSIPSTYAATNRALLQAGQGVSALLRGQYERAIESYNKALESRDLSDVRRANILNDRGVAKWRLKRTKEAISDFNAAVELFSDYALVYNNRGNALMDLGRPDEAMQDFERAVSLAPNYGVAHNNKGNALLAMGRHDEALKAFAKAVQYMPNNAVPFNGRGKAHSALARPYAAMRDFNRALVLNAKYGNAYRNRASALLSLDRHKQAVDDLSKVIGNNPEDPELYMARANAYAVIKKYGKAYKDLSKAIELAPESTEALAIRGLMQAELRNYKGAQKDFSQAITLSPNYTKAYVNRAQTYLKMGQPEEGLADANRALAINPRSAQAFKVRAEIYRELGREGEAESDLAKAVQFDPAMAQSDQAPAGLQEQGQAPAEIARPIGEPFEDWTVRQLSNGRYVATNPKYKGTKVSLEMHGPGEPALLDWKLRKNALRGIGLLRYYAGQGEKGDRIEYTAIVDLWQKRVVAIEPHRMDGKEATWAWQQVAVVVTDPQGTPSEIKLRRARPQQQRRGWFGESWFGAPTQQRQRPRRRAPSGNPFGWLFGN